MQEETGQTVIWVLGERDSGKTAVIAATMTALALRSPRPMFDGEIDLVFDFDPRTEIKIDYARIPFTHEAREYLFLEPSGSIPEIRAKLRQEVRIDAAILVVSLVDGPGDTTRKLLLLARYFGITTVTIFLNRADEVDYSEVRIDTAKARVMRLLGRIGYSKANPIFAGSAIDALAGHEDALKILDKMISEV